ncbi:MAG TPA: hypothetical protein VIP52_05030 [Candidatus Dormibacteraeota bacterium]|jgi:hypothetical protein
MEQQAPGPSQASPGSDSSKSDEGKIQTGLRWEPTDTTRRMQLLAGGYLLVAGLLTALLSFSAERYVRQATEQSIRDQNPDLSAGQVKALADFDLTLAVTIVALLGLILAAFGIMTLLRHWVWLFYADLVICGLSGLGVFTGIFGLARGSAGPPGLAIPSFILAAAGLALFIWMLERLVQGGVWGARKVPAAPSR